jgi:hypothetical protein
MNASSTVNVVLAILGAALLTCLGGIIWLASANPARPVPDILVGTTTLIVGGIVGILVPPASRDRAAPPSGRSPGVPERTGQESGALT